MRKILLALVVLCAASQLGEAKAGGPILAGHPYHSGHLFVPPSSAYEAVRVMPPARYGVPYYYYPASYLPYGYYPVAHPAAIGYGVPYGRAGGYYLSSHAYYGAAYFQGGR